MRIRKVFGSLGDVHVSTVLTNVAIAYMQTEEGFVAGRIFPRINVNKQADLYRVFDRDQRDDFKLRAPATESQGLVMSTSTDLYFARKWALHYDIPDEERANSDGDINLDRMTTRRLIEKGLLRQERIFTDTWFKDGVWGTTVQGTTASPAATQFVMWDDATSTPIEDIRAAATIVQLRTGKRPNKLVLAQQVYDKLVNHPDIIDRIKYSSTNDNPAIVTRRALAALFEVENVFVMSAVENTAKEGLTATNAFFGGKHALLLYSPNAASTEEPSAGYTFNFTAYLGNSPDGIRVKKFRMEKLEADRVEAEMFFDMKQTASDLGYFFQNAVR